METFLGAPITNISGNDPVYAKQIDKILSLMQLRIENDKIANNYVGCDNNNKNEHSNETEDNLLLNILNEDRDKLVGLLIIYIGLLLEIHGAMDDDTSFYKNKIKELEKERSEKIVINFDENFKTEINEHRKKLEIISNNLLDIITKNKEEIDKFLKD